MPPRGGHVPGMLWYHPVLGSPVSGSASARKMAPAMAGADIFQSETLQHHPRFRSFCTFLGVPLVGGAVRD
jgi:hypothetical protein